jgi:hypothetical protein
MGNVAEFAGRAVLFPLTLGTSELMFLAAYENKQRANDVQDRKESADEIMLRTMAIMSLSNQPNYLLRPQQSIPYRPTFCSAYMGENVANYSCY